MHRTVKSFFLAMSLCTGFACVIDADGDADDDAGANDDSGASAVEIESTCQAYCDKAVECDDDVTLTTCVADCKENMGDCMADEQEKALSDLNSCAADACDDFTGCTIGAGLQCTFGV